ncbi:MAG: RdgB/HAM1 family non-canonical purine NTP pyrophosphatase [Pirellulaceae bacterium]
MDELKRKKLLVGSGNVKKKREVAALLEPLGWQLVSLGDLPPMEEPEESGSDFLENAKIKATYYANASGLWTLGEDSGLCVAALGNAPGVFSARYSGPGATDQRNNAKLIEQLSQVAEHARAAFYVSTAAVAKPDGTIVATSRGECHGRITKEPRGEAGFGYDPYFELVEYHKTFAELGMMVKNCLSHRARALEKLVVQLDRMFDEQKK